MSVPDFSASGKLLLFGEYLVLRGAKALAVPVNFGQRLRIKYAEPGNIFWESFEQGREWLRITLTPAIEIVDTSDNQKAEIVRQLLLKIKEENPGIMSKGIRFRFDLDFDRNYGWGTSSTLISLLALWSGVDPFLLQKRVFNGSGYDVAAATANGPFMYQIPENDISHPLITPVEISEEVSSRLLFIYTGQKQISSKEVSSFGRIQTAEPQISEMNKLVGEAAACNSIAEFEKLIRHSEKLLSGILQRQAIQERMFGDYPFAVKSLGAWGGDFIMATFRGKQEAVKYFRRKGSGPLFEYKQLVKNGG